MPLYTYKAADASGKVIKGSLEAATEKIAAGRIQDMNCIPIWIGESARAGSAVPRSVLGNIRLKGAFTLFSRISNRDVMRFTQDLAGLLKAGLPVDRALSILRDVGETEKFRKTIGDVLRSVQSGAYLSDAMARHPAVFSDFYVNMTRAGEAGGVLEAVLERLGIFMESRQELRDFVTSALVYPVFLVAVSGISIIILMTFVIPKFAIIFSDMRNAIPWSTRFLLEMSEMLRSYWWALIPVIAGAWFAFRLYSRTPSGRLRLDRMRISLPVLGDFFKKVEVARFARTLGTLVKSGVPILQALDLVRATVGNQVVSAAVKQVNERVKEGDRLSKPMADAHIFPPLAVQMITVGEESGKLDEMLLRVAEQYEKTVRNLVKRFIALLEPCLILVMGLAVGFIVISMLMAIFSINDISF